MVGEFKVVMLYQNLSGRTDLNRYLQNTSQISHSQSNLSVLAIHESLILTFTSHIPVHDRHKRD
jgi:hypothetical protein